jgi:pentatricopeptide repeat domain-containing protein 1
VYQQLRESGFDANSTTYNALISAYGKLGQLERVLEVYQDMVWRGLERRCVTVCRAAAWCVASVCVQLRNFEGHA